MENTKGKLALGNSSLSVALASTDGNVMHIQDLDGICIPQREATAFLRLICH